MVGFTQLWYISHRSETDVARRSVLVCKQVGQGDRYVTAHGQSMDPQARTSPAEPRFDAALIAVTSPAFNAYNSMLDPARNLYGPFAR